MEIRELENKLAETGPASAPEVVPADDSEQATPKEKKLTRAQQRHVAKQEEERRVAAAASNNTASSKPNPRDKELDILVERVGNLGLNIVDIPPNGDCLYAAVAHQRLVIDSETVSVQQLREVAATTMKKAPALFKSFLPEGETLETYTAKVKTPAEWGGEIELRALSLGLRRPIFVHSARSPTLEMCRDEFPTAPVYHLTFHELQYSLGEHYNSASLSHS